MKNILRWLVPCFGLRLSFGSESSASTSNSTEVRDMRVVGGEGSANVSANDSNVTLFTTDHGAVMGGLTLGSQAVDSIVKSGDNLVSATKSMFGSALDYSRSALENSRGTLTSALDFADNQTDKVANAYDRASNAQSGAFNSAIGELAGAWATSKSPDTQTFKWAGMAVVAVAAIAFIAPRFGK